ncbi:MAG: SCO family protein [Anaerolineae bacterium]|nr:SCO family protein [Anaerolineae bacterium]
MRNSQRSLFVSPIWLGLLGIALGLVLALAAYAIGKALRPPQILRGAMLNPPIPAVDFNLLAEHDQNITLYEYRGQPVLLAFSCQNCPRSATLMSKLTQVKSGASGNNYSVEVIVVNLNPERESIQSFAEFIHAFDTDFVAVSGNLRDVTDIAHSYDVYFGYAQNDFVESNPLIFLIDAQGYWRSVYPLNMSTADINSDIEIIWQDR